MIALLQSQDLVYVIFIGVALGVFLMFTGITQVLSRREAQTEAKSRAA